MTRKDFLKEFAEKAGLTNKDAKAVVEVLEEMTLDHMKDPGGFSPIKGLTLSVVHKEAHTARNPMTGGTVDVPEKYIPKARFGKRIKEGIN